MDTISCCIQNALAPSGVTGVYKSRAPHLWPMRSSSFRCSCRCTALGKHRTPWVEVHRICNVPTDISSPRGTLEARAASAGALLHSHYATGARRRATRNALHRQHTHETRPFGAAALRLISRSHRNMRVHLECNSRSEADCTRCGAKDRRPANTSLGKHQVLTEGALDCGPPAKRSARPSECT